MPHRRLPLVEAAPKALSDDSPMMLVGELARETGKTVRAIHLYEDLGLLRPADRSKGRYRLFGTDALLRVRFISKLQNLGLSLTEIQALLRAQEDSDSAMVGAARLREVYLVKLAETQAKLRELRQLEQELTESLVYLNACDTACTTEAPVHSCPSCERVEEREMPDLVLGVHAN